MPGPYVRLITHGREERVPLTGTRVGIGRAADNELSIPDLSLSREHAVIELAGDGEWSIRDLGSRNGTYVQDVLLTGPVVLEDGSVIRLGDTTLIFRESATSGVHLSDRGDSLSEGTLVIPAEQLIRGRFQGADETHVRIIDSLVKATRLLISRDHADDVLPQILDEAIRQVGGERGALMVLEGDPPELVARATRLNEDATELRFSSTIANTVIEQKTSILTTDAMVDPRFDGAHSISLQGIRAAVCAPLYHEDVVSGLLYVDRRFSKRPFSENDLSILTILANLTAAKLEHDRLLAESELKRKMDEELKLAADIQRRLLPAGEPDLAGWEFAAMSEPSRSVGGDMYDFWPRGSGLALVVADVSGKGVSAALLMASLQANLRAFASTSDDPAEVMCRVNEALSRSSAANRFATVFFADLDPASGRLRYVNGGHNPPLLLRADGSVELLRVGGMIVGAFAGFTEYQVGLATMRPGDILLLYSDGVTEAETAAGDQFGDDRLEATLIDLGDRSAAALRDGIVDAIAQFTGGLPPSDDTTLLVVRRLSA